MPNLSQISVANLESHSYQFSYDASKSKLDNPLQTILQMFVENEIIDISSKFIITYPNKDISQYVTMVRPVESTWLFQSKKTLLEIIEFLDAIENDMFNYAISEIRPQAPFMFALNHAELRNMDEELEDAINAINNNNQ